MFEPDMSAGEADLLASLIEEEDFAASLGETLYQIARRMERQPFSAVGRPLATATIDRVDQALRVLLPDTGPAGPPSLAEDRREFLVATRERCLTLGNGLPWEERGALLELLGSAERAFFLIDRVDAERRSVPRAVAAPVITTRPGLAAALAPASG
jgi:phosphate:Na+ symporter